MCLEAHTTSDTKRNLSEDVRVEKRFKNMVESNNRFGFGITCLKYVSSCICMRLSLKNYVKIKDYHTIRTFPIRFFKCLI